MGEGVVVEIDQALVLDVLLLLGGNLVPVRTPPCINSIWSQTLKTYL